MPLAAAVAAVTCGCVGARSHYVCKVSESNDLAHLNLRFPKAFEFLRRNDLATLKAGTYVLEGSEDGEKSSLYAMVQDVDLLPFAGETQHAEAHAKYIDIQMPISGDETYGIYDLDPSDPAFRMDESPSGRRARRAAPRAAESVESARTTSALNAE